MPLASAWPAFTRNKDHRGKCGHGSKAINDAMKNGKPIMTDQQCNGVLMSFMQKAKAEKASAAKKEGLAFLEKNRTQPGVVTMPDGLQYLVIKQGDGPKPTLTDKVKCHYHGTLIDGTVFDSSVDRGQPIDFPVNGVIPGWTEGLQMMPVGSKWRLFIPSSAMGIKRPAKSNRAPL